jgi:hypothetical protein
VLYVAYYYYYQAVVVAEMKRKTGVGVELRLMGVRKAVMKMDYQRAVKLFPEALTALEEDRMSSSSSYAGGARRSGMRSRRVILQPNYEEAGAPQAQDPVLRYF